MAAKEGMPFCFAELRRAAARKTERERLIAERELPRNPNWKRPVLRVFAWALFTAGAGTTTYGATDLIFSAQEEQSQKIDIEQKYPPVSEKDLDLVLTIGGLDLALFASLINRELNRKKV